MPGGRPSKYEERYCEALVEHCKDGSSLSSFAASIDVARSTLNEWAEQHEEFSEAVSRAKAHCAAWWEKVARSNAVDGKGNATLCIFGLKNMGADDWRDKQEHEHSGPGGGPIRHDLTRLSKEEARALEEMLLKTGGAGA